MIKITSSENISTQKPRKKVWGKKWWWIVGVIIVVIFIIAISSGGGNKDLFSQYIQTDKVKEYKLMKSEDISFGNILRMKYSVIVPSDISEDELKSTLAKIIKEKAEKNKDIDEIVVYAWDSKESFEGMALPLGYAEWCPYGKWDGVTSEIAEKNIRDNYKIVFHINKESLEAIQKRKESEIKFGLDEETRRKIAYELEECEIKGNFEANKYYLPGCEKCPEFIEANSKKLVDKIQELTESCKAKVRDKYHISPDIETAIIKESLEENWPGPESRNILPPCCKSGF